MSYPMPILMVPYRGHIQSGIYPGRMLRVTGTVNPAALRFAINLQCGPNTEPRDDIAIHLSPHFDTCTVKRNTLASLKWGPEENFGHFPFGQGQPFEVVILCEETHFKIAVNGQHYVEYEHRLPYHRVSHITIDGDISLSSVMFEDPPPHQVPGVTAVPPQPAYVTPMPQQECYHTQQDHYTPTYIGQPEPTYIESGRNSNHGGFMRYAAPAAAGLAVGGVGGYLLSNALYSSSSDSD